jgi:predicted O-methyltransferase YrrM
MMRTMLRPWKRLMMRTLGISALAEQQATTQADVARLGSACADLDSRMADLRGPVEEVRRVLATATPADIRLAVEDVRTLLTSRFGQQLDVLEGLVRDVTQAPGAKIPDWLNAALPGKTPDEIRQTVTGWAEAQQAGRMLVMDYPPSYDYRPRWGYQTPPHEGLTRLLDRDAADHLEVCRRVTDLLPYFQKIKTTFSHDTPGEPAWVGGAINPIDTAVLYQFMVTARPKTFLEIGSGLSTLFAARAKADHGLSTRIVSIDPNPRAAVDAQCDEVIRQPFEKGDLSVFDRLEPGDIVFMDGSHRTFTNSDVTVFMLDVLPRLKPGVLVHVHDVCLPYDYPEYFVAWHWNEQYILGVYLLASAARIKVLMPVWHTVRKPEMADVLAPLTNAGWAGPPAGWQYGGSIWFTHT